MKATDEALTIVAMTALEAAFEDGERREDLGQMIGIPRLATAHGIPSPDGFQVYFENGDQYVIELNVRPVGLTAQLARRESAESDPKMSSCAFNGFARCIAKPEYDCPEAVKRDISTGRWYITMGHAGFNTRANNGTGYESITRARSAIRRIVSR